MATRRVIAPHIDFSALRLEFTLPGEYPAEALAEARRIAASQPPGGSSPDLTDVPFVTIDPPTSLDLDQAMCLTRRPGGGYRVDYAIADVARFVPPGGPLDAEVWRRGQTVYLPDGNVPLHPRVLSEGAASLLPDQVRHAVVWRIGLTADGEVADVQVCRARVRSRAKLDYAGVQAALDRGDPPEPVALLPEIGKLLIERGLDRGAIDLPIPDQEVCRVNGGWDLVLRAPLPVERFNAQISLLTGRVAADIMMTGRIGLLRTMPPAPPDAVAGLRTAASSLGIDWPAGATPGRVVASVDPGQPRGAAFLDRAAELMRGAGYTAFDGSVPEQPVQSAVAAPYAHVTAPLRRLADRFAAEVCLALSAGEQVPAWARAALPRLPEVMSGSDHRAGAASRAAVELAEAVLLEHRVGEEFAAAVLDVSEGGGQAAAPDHLGADGTGRGGAGGPSARPGRRPPHAVVALEDLAVQGRCDGPRFEAGERIRVRLTAADPAERRILFERC